MVPHTCCFSSSTAVPHSNSTTTFREIITTGESKVSFNRITFCPSLVGQCFCFLNIFLIAQRHSSSVKIVFCWCCKRRSHVNDSVNFSMSCVWCQNVLVPVPCPRSPSPLVAGRDPVQAPAGQPERRKQPANQEQLLLFLQEQSEDLLIQNEWDYLKLYRGHSLNVFLQYVYFHLPSGCKKLQRRIHLCLELLHHGKNQNLDYFDQYLHHNNLKQLTWETFTDEKMCIFNSEYSSALNII